MAMITCPVCKVHTEMNDWLMRAHLMQKHGWSKERADNWSSSRFVDKLRDTLGKAGLGGLL